MVDLPTLNSPARLAIDLPFHTLSHTFSLSFIVGTTLFRLSVQTSAITVHKMEPATTLQYRPAANYKAHALQTQVEFVNLMLVCVYYGFNTKTHVKQMLTKLISHVHEHASSSHTISKRVKDCNVVNVRGCGLIVATQFRKMHVFGEREIAIIRGRGLDQCSVNWSLDK